MPYLRNRHLSSADSYTDHAAPMAVRVFCSHCARGPFRDFWPPVLAIRQGQGGHE
jgi:hypothetical protein